MLNGARTIRRLCALGAMSLMLGIAACGDDEEPAGDGSASAPATAEESAPATAEESAPAEGGGGEALTLEAVEDGGLAFEPPELSAAAGEVTITMTNPEGNQLPHNVELEGDGVEEAGEVVEAGGTSEVTADLQPGSYTFYCAVGQHRENGMEGTLTVE